jgi:hypothetical protein
MDTARSQAASIILLSFTAGSRQKSATRTSLSFCQIYDIISKEKVTVYFCSAVVKF